MKTPALSRSFTTSLGFLFVASLGACSSNDAPGRATSDESTDASTSADSSTDSGTLPDSSTDASTTPDSSRTPDANTDASDEAPVPCGATSTSTIPGVHFALKTGDCTFRLSEAAAGITIPYELVVDAPVPGFTPRANVGYPDFTANLYVEASLDGAREADGGGQHYCLCDRGLPLPSCPLEDGGVAPTSGPDATCAAVTIPKGTFPLTFAWDGKNWNGPSDTSNPKGPAFPAGDYTLTISTHEGSIDGGAPAKASMTVTIHLVP